MAPDRPSQKLPPGVPADAAQRAYLFRCADDGGLRAISLDPAAANIPRQSCQAHWIPEGEVIVGVQEALPLALNPEPVLRGLRSVGYYVWTSPAAPTSTTQ